MFSCNVGCALFSVKCVPVLVSFPFNIYREQFYRVQVGIQSPEGITTTRGILRRFNDFLKLSSEVSDISFGNSKVHEISFWKV